VCCCVCCVCLRAFVILIMANKASRPKVGVPMAINCQFSIMPVTCGSHLHGLNLLFAFLTASLTWPTLLAHSHTHTRTPTMAHKYQCQTRSGTSLTFWGIYWLHPISLNRAVSNAVHFPLFTECINYPEVYHLIHHLSNHL